MPRNASRNLEFFSDKSGKFRAEYPIFSNETGVLQNFDIFRSPRTFFAAASAGSEFLRSPEHRFDKLEFDEEYEQRGKKATLCKGRLWIVQI